MRQRSTYLIQTSPRARPARNPGFSSPCEDPHLCRRPEDRIRIAYSLETNFIGESIGNAARPGLELDPGPFEAVVDVAQLMAMQRLKPDVVLDVRCRQHNRLRPGGPEHNGRETIQHRYIDMFDDLDHCRRIEASKPLVAVSEGTVKKRDAFALALR